MSTETTDGSKAFQSGSLASQGSLGSPSQKWTLGLFVALGAVVLASYVFLIQHSRANASSAQQYWFGIEPEIQRVYYVMMALAAAGFCAVTAWYCGLKSLPERGLLKHAWVIPLLFGVILTASAGWSFAVALAPGAQWLVALLLVVVAAASILLLAGVVEAEKRKWWAVLGAVAFAATTVLNDGVGWLANYLVKKA